MEVALAPAVQRPPAVVVYPDALEGPARPQVQRPVRLPLGHDAVDCDHVQVVVGHLGAPAAVPLDLARVQESHDVLHHSLDEVAIAAEQTRVEVAPLTFLQERLAAGRRRPRPVAAAAGVDAGVERVRRQAWDRINRK